MTRAAQRARPRLLDELAAHPLRVGVIGAGKFAQMYIHQARLVPGLELAWVADLDLGRAQAAGARRASTDALALIEREEADVVVEATGSPTAGARHALAAIEAGAHVVMVTVEADVVAGPELARRAAAAGVVYSLAYGDQPALICELVDWARLCGFRVACAGKGTKYEPGFELVTPDDVWQHYGVRPQNADAQMFTSFIDGSKSAIEMAAVCNACDLTPQPGGLHFPPVGTAELAELGARVPAGGTVEVVSGDDMRWGVYVIWETGGGFAASNLDEYGVQLDATGEFAVLYRPYHLIGLELATSVVRAGLRGEATGTARSLRAEAVSRAKRDLVPGDIVDGEGGHAAYGTLMASHESQGDDALPLGMAKGAVVQRRVARGDLIRTGDVELDPATQLLAGLRDASFRSGGVERRDSALPSY
jgi:predicted homoserine dehydrogenase-like protein